MVFTNESTGKQLYEEREVVKMLKAYGRIAEIYGKFVCAHAEKEGDIFLITIYDEIPELKSTIPEKMAGRLEYIVKIEEAIRNLIDSRKRVK